MPLETSSAVDTLSALGPMHLPIPDLLEQPSFRLIVLDWDGTVVDSIEPIVDCSLEAFEETAGRAGFPVPPREAVQYSIGSGLAATILELVPQLPEEWVARVAGRYRELWLERHHERVRPFPGIEAVLAELCSQGYQLAVATAKRRSGLDRELSRFGFRGFFSSSRTVDEAPPKPDPGMLLGLLEEFRLEPWELLMVGDSCFDLQMARAADCPAIGVLSGAQPASLLEPHAPLAVIERLHLLPQWLREHTEVPTPLGSAAPPQ